MTELNATIDQRAAAAQAAHTYAWQMQRKADLAGEWLGVAFWAETCEACLEELADCANAMRAGVDRDTPADHGDAILRANADLVSESAYYPHREEAA